jgi:hypothetical protein
MAEGGLAGVVGSITGIGAGLGAVGTALTGAIGSALAAAGISGIFGSVVKINNISLAKITFK